MTPHFPTSKNSTSVRFSLPPRFLTAPLRWAPWLQKPVLSRLFLTPLRRAPAARGDAGAVVARFVVGQGRVRVRARGRGPRVLLVHGWQGSSLYLKSIADQLVGHGFTAVTFDMPAHGETSGSRTNLLEFVEAIERAADIVGPVHGIVGHSLGATAIALALAQGLRVSAATLIAPMLSVEFALDEFSKMLELTPEMRAATKRGTEDRLGASRWQVDLLGLPPPPVELLVVHDRGDKRVPFSHSESLLGHFKQARLVSTEGLGHRRILDDSAVLSAILAHLRSAPVPRDPPLSFECAPEMRL